MTCRVYVVECYYFPQNVLYYNSPIQTPSSKGMFYEYLHTIVKECDYKEEIILMGDFNMNWRNKTCRKKLKDITDYESDN